MGFFSLKQHPCTWKVRTFEKILENVPKIVSQMVVQNGDFLDIK